MTLWEKKDIKTTIKLKMSASVKTIMMDSSQLISKGVRKCRYITILRYDVLNCSHFLVYLQRLMAVVLFFVVLCLRL